MRHFSTALNALGFLWACGATAYLLATSGHEGTSTASALTGAEAGVGHMTLSLASTNGAWIVLLLLAVTMLAGVPFGVAMSLPERHRAVTWVVGLLLLGFALMAGFTVGFIYLPGAVVLLVSAAAPALVAPDPMEGR
jgi:hypothetical protein